MEIEEYLKYREELLEESKDSDGFITETAFLYSVLSSMQEAKLIDSVEIEESYFLQANENIKINGYLINESGERLQLFILNESSINLASKDEDLKITQKNFYDLEFNRALKFINKASKGHLDEETQDSSPSKPLISFISSVEGIQQIDVIEIFLVSATATIETRGTIPQPKRIEFEDDLIKLSYSNNREKKKKEILVIKRLIDLNFLYAVLVSQGNREVLEIDFEKSFNYKIECIKAADEENFESYLGILPGRIISELYKRHSSRILEKNVRSFLQVRGVNQSIRDTIRREPEKFIAFNNGLTITAVGKNLVQENMKLYLKALTDFQIVNGGQTTASIYFAQKDGLAIDKIRVMAKINVAKNKSEEELNELITKISSSSNAQTRVSPVDLRSRNPQLVKLKSLSESVLTPSGYKWYFERFKGEFNTLIRKSPKQKTRINNEFPKTRRFTKEELAKYYSAWGEQPYLVKKGGEKIFRYFIEEISDEEKGKKSVEINRDYYEEIVSRIILFRTLEEMYGSGKQSMGQIRSSVIPYTIAIVYKATSGSKQNKYFDFSKIWLAQGLDDGLSALMSDLMLLMNDLIKKYSKSDDVGEYSKKKELWDDILISDEIRQFTNSENFNKIIKGYTLTKDEIAKRQAKRTKIKDVDFKELHSIVEMFMNTSSFYKLLRSKLGKDLLEFDDRALTRIIACIQNIENISSLDIEFERNFIQRVRVSNPDLFDSISIAPDLSYKKTLDFIVKRYNSAIAANSDLTEEFRLIKEEGQKNGIKFMSVFDEIAKELKAGKCPDVKQLNLAWNYVSTLGS